MNSPVVLPDPIVNTMSQKIVMNKNGKKKNGGGPRPKVQTLTAPVARTERRVTVAPQVRTARNGNTVVKHREFVTTIFAQSSLVPFLVNMGLDVGLYAVQPMNPPTFNWLVGLAAHFDEYKFLNMRVTYTPVCGTTLEGRVALFWDPDSQDPGPIDRTDLASYTGSVDTPPWAQVTMTVPCDGKFRLIEDNPTADTKLLDMGRIGFATYATSSTAAAGDLYIEYEVELRRTQPMSNMTRFAVGAAGTLTSIVGPRYFDIVGFAASFITAAFVTPGVYQMFYITTGTTTAHVLPVLSNGGAVTNFSTTNSATKSMSTCTITVPTSTVQCQFIWVGAMTNFNLWGYKSSRVSNATI